MKTWDVTIIGGGPAGLSAAMLLGRSIRSVLVIDKGEPRNAASKAAHGYLTRDGIPPAQFLQLARENLQAYPSVQWQKGTATHAEVTGYGFETTLADGQTVQSRKLIVASGMRDHLPPIQGLHEAYGLSIFPCPFCDGWERRNEPLALIGHGGKTFEYVKKLYNWSKDIFIFTNGATAFDSDQLEEMNTRGIKVTDERIERLISVDGMLQAVVLADGTSIARSGGFLADTGAREASDIPAQLGVPTDQSGKYETLAHGKTAVDGLYIIGDAKNGFTGIVGAASEGYEAGTVLVQELALEDWDRCR